MRQKAAMMEIFILLSLFVALAWAVVSALLILMRGDALDESAAQRTDPISTYVDENHGSHFVEDPVSVNRSMRRR